MSKATFYKYWDRLLEVELVKPTRSFGKTTLYKLNEANPIVGKIKELEMALIERAIPVSAEAVTA